jgi:hypothetical protein
MSKRMTEESRKFYEESYRLRNKVAQEKTQAEIAAEEIYNSYDNGMDKDRWDCIELMKLAYEEGQNAKLSLEWKKVDKDNMPKVIVLMKYGNLISLGSFTSTEKFLVFTSISDVTLYYPLGKGGALATF